MIGTSRSGSSLFITYSSYSSTNPQDSLWHLVLRGKQDDGKPLLNMAGYG